MNAVQVFVACVIIGYLFIIIKLLSDIRDLLRAK